MVSISAVSKAYSVSTRTLRYYEQIGLLQGQRPGPYRAYDDESLRRLRQILVLRRLCVPLKRVAEILDAASPEQAVALLRETIRETEDELTRTSALRSAQFALLRVLEGESRSVPALLDTAADTLFPSLSRPIMKEDLKMSEIKPEMTQTQRVIFLPPMTVASARAFAKEPENAAFAQLAAFIRQTRLWEKKPDLRIFGFNNPSIPNENGEYGYEYWVTLPDDVEPAAPLTKRTFTGGLYAAHCIKMGDFHEWKPFSEKVRHSGEYAPDARGPEGMWGSLEEHIGAYQYFAHSTDDTRPFAQLDLLIPIRELK